MLTLFFVVVICAGVYALFLFSERLMTWSPVDVEDEQPLTPIYAPLPLPVLYPEPELTDHHVSIEETHEAEEKSFLEMEKNQGGPVEIVETVDVSIDKPWLKPIVTIPAHGGLK